MAHLVYFNGQPQVPPAEEESIRKDFTAHNSIFINATCERMEGAHPRGPSWEAMAGAEPEHGAFLGCFFCSLLCDIKTGMRRKEGLGREARINSA